MFRRLSRRLPISTREEGVPRNMRKLQVARTHRGLSQREMMAATGSEPKPPSNLTLYQELWSSCFRKWDPNQSVPAVSEFDEVIHVFLWFGHVLNHGRRKRRVSSVWGLKKFSVRTVVFPPPSRQTFVQLAFVFRNASWGRHPDCRWRKEIPGTKAVCVLCTPFVLACESCCGVQGAANVPQMPFVKRS